MINLILTIIILQTNLYRLQNNVPILIENKELNQIAQIRSKEIYETGKFQHDLSWGNKTNCSYLGENLAKNLINPFENWINSPSHKANILSKNYNQIGIGKTGPYTVQIFCHQ